MGKIVIVTGGTSGIGLHTACLLYTSIFDSNDLADKNNMWLPAALEIWIYLWPGGVIRLYFRCEIFLGKLVLIQLFAEKC